MSGSLFAVALLALPWLNPFAAGPSPAVQPWLVTLACVALLLLLLPGRSSVRPQTVAAAWLVAGLLSCVIALCQYFGVESRFSPWMTLSDGQVYANLWQRNQFATLAAIGLLSLLWWSGRGTHSVRVVRRLLVGAAALLAFGLSASSSRTGLLELALILLLAMGWGWWRTPLPRMVLLTAVLAYGAATWLLPMLAGLDPTHSGVLSRFGGDGCGSRLVLWRNVLELIAQHPWTGWGWGELDYAHFVHLYESPRFCGLLDNAHNLPLHLAVELGIPVALLSCAALGGVVIKARPWQEQDATRQLAWTVLTMILLHSLVEYPLWYGPFQMTVGLCLGLLWPRLLAPRYGRRAWHRLAALSLLATVAYAAWDYHRVSQIYLAPEQRAAAYRDNTLEKIRASHLFRGAVRFAELTLAPLTHDNAVQVNAEAHALLHFSPEPRVIEKLIESAVLLGRDSEARDFIRRYQAAYPQAYDDWRRLAAAAAAD